MTKDVVTQADLDAFPNKSALEDAAFEISDDNSSVIEDVNDNNSEESGHADADDADTTDAPEENSESDAEIEGDEPHHDDDSAEKEYSDIEQQAIDNGWVPEDQFKGDKDNWVSAKRWMKNKHVFDELDSLRKSEKKTKEAFSTMMELMKKREEKDNAAQITKLKESKREAILEGDVDLVNEIDEKINNISSDLEAVQKIVTPDQQETADETHAFIDRNKHWFNNEHKQERDYAVEYEGLLAKNRKNISLSERFELVEQEVERVFGIKRVGVAKKVNSSPAPKKYMAPKHDNSPRMKDLPRNIQQMVYKFCDIHNKDPKSKSKMTPDQYVKDMHKKGLLD